jgi:Starch-binding associating with outer membrane
MKHEGMKKIWVSIIIVILMDGCSKSKFITDLQSNPNAPSTTLATPELILPGTITGISNIINDGSTYSSLAVWMGYWNGQPGSAELTNITQYVMTNTGPQSWNNYFGVLTNLNALIQASPGSENSNYRDIAQILETICFKNLVDLYNDIPYSQALQASGNFYPKYDQGSDVYDSLTAKLNIAMADIQANLKNTKVLLPTTDDVMFAGHMQNWLLLANTLKLRLLVNQSNVSNKAAYIASEISKTAFYGYLINDALVNPVYSPSQPGNIWATFGVSPSGGLNAGSVQFGANQTAIDFYTATQDLRLPYFYSPRNVLPTSADFYSVVLPPDFSDFAGNYCGSQDDIPGGSSDLGPGIIQAPAQSAVMISAAESFFIQAEATVRGWLPGGNAAAQILYQNGITKSYEYLKVGGSAGTADAFANAYYSQDLPFVSFPPGASNDSLIHTIITQKWAALNSINILEPYNDWRRTFNAAIQSGYPMVPVSISSDNTKPHMPFRYYYPLEEQTSNNAAWTAEGGANVDPFTSKIFWMP